MTELNYRQNNGLEITLLWDEASGEIFVAVWDQQNDSETVIPVAPEKASDAFMHPFAYMHAAPGNSYPVAA